jgi:hypothetical protein
MSSTSLTEAHRRAIGSRLAAMSESIREVRTLDFDNPHLQELEDEIERFAVEVNAIRKPPPPNRARAVLAQLLLLSHELRPNTLRAYGELGEAEHVYLERQATRLAELVERAIDALEIDRERRQQLPL